jgi:acyl carrier protein
MSSTSATVWRRSSLSSIAVSAIVLSPWFDEDLTDDAHFIEDLEVDSLMALEVMVVLEKKYGVKLDESELKQVTTLEKTYNLLDARLNGAP